MLVNIINIKDKEYKDFFKQINTIETANNLVIHWITSKTKDSLNAKKHMKKYLSDNKLDGMEWYSIEKYAEYQQELSNLELEMKSLPNSIRLLNKVKTNNTSSIHKNTSFIQEFNVLKHTFYAFNFCECGVTHLGDNTKNFIVIVDCHH